MVLSLLIIFICSFSGWYAFQIFDEWRSITSNRFVLNMVKGHHLQLWSHPPLFCNFQQFNVKVATNDHPIIQKEVDELLAKGAIEPSYGGAGFYSSMFVVPKHIGGLWPILILKHFNFPKSDLCLTQSFCFLGLCWDTVHMSVSLPPDKLADIQQLALSLLQSQHVTVCWVISFLGKANFCTNGHSQLWHLSCHSE